MTVAAIMSVEMLTVFSVLAGGTYAPAMVKKQPPPGGAKFVHSSRPVVPLCSCQKDTQQTLVRSKQTLVRSKQTLVRSVIS